MSAIAGSVAVAAIALAIVGHYTRSTVHLAHGLRTAEAAAKPAVSRRQACGSASAAAVAEVDTVVAERIYKGELHSGATSIDVAHITGSRDLLRALASSNTAAVYAAVHRIVYMPHWHIVRLRVLQRGRVVADIGGPYIIAPVSGTLKLKGHEVGRFVMSVQDDLGYMKLLSRFIGVPVDIYSGGSLVMGTLHPGPPSVSSGRTFSRSGVDYTELVIQALAFPTGTLKAVLFLPVPSQALAAHSCEEVQRSAWINVIRHIAARFHPLASNYAGLVDTLHGSTAGIASVRVGARRLAGAAEPKRIPDGGLVSLKGRTWSVASWSPQSPTRVYLLTPAR